jgi:hypothetical protein
MTDELREHICAAIASCMSRGMHLPFVVSAICPDGSVFWLSVESWPTELKVAQESHDADLGGRATTIFVVDQKQETAKCIVTASLDKPVMQ